MTYQNLHLRSNVQGKEPVAGSAAGQLPVGSIAINYNKDEPFLSIQDSAGAIRRIAGVKVGATEPATPTAGETWLDTSVAGKEVFKVYDGTAWQGAGGGTSSGTTAPTVAHLGDLWVDTSVATSPTLKVYDGTNWNSVAPGAGSTTAPATPSAGQVWVDSSTVPSTVKVYDGTNWVTQVGNAITSSTAPSSPTTGQVWIDSSKSPPTYQIWDGAAWVPMTPDSASASVLSNDARYVNISGDTMTGALKMTDGTGTSLNLDPGASVAPLVRDSAGRLGVGTSSPNYNLQVESVSATVSVKDPGDNTGPRAVRFVYSFDDGDGASVNAIRAASETFTDVDLSFRTGGITDSEEKMRILSNGRVGIGTVTPGARLHGVVDATWNSTDYAFVFENQETQNSYGNAVRIVGGGGSGAGHDGSNLLAVGDNDGNIDFLVRGDGNVGIGTTSPASKLQIQDSADVDLRLLSGDTNLASIFFGDTGYPSRGRIVYDNSDDSLGFWGAGGATSAERLRLDASGRLLVGTQTSLDLNTPFQVASTSTGAQIIRYTATAGLAGGSLDLSRSASDVIGTASAVTHDQGLGVIRFRGAGSSTAYVTGATIEAAVDSGTVSAASMPTLLSFRTTPNGGNSSLERMRIDSNGRVHFNTAGQNPSDTVEGVQIHETGCIFCSTDGDPSGFFNRNTSDGAVVGFRRSNVAVGSVSVTTTATAYNTSSDYRLKENVVPLTGAADRVKQLKPSKFNFKADPSKTVDGFLAHEAQAVVPEAVHGTKDQVQAIGTLTSWNGNVLQTDVPEPESLTFDEEVVVTPAVEAVPATFDDDGNELTPAVDAVPEVTKTVTRTNTWQKTGERPAYQGIDQSKLVPLLTAALQEALTRIEQLEAKVTALEGGAPAKSSNPGTKTRR